jgi:hypothetical protein
LNNLERMLQPIGGPVGQTPLPLKRTNLFFQIQTIEPVVQRKVRDLPARSKLEWRQHRFPIDLKQLYSDCRGICVHHATVWLPRSVSARLVALNPAPVSVASLLPFSREQKPNLGAWAGLPNTLVAPLRPMQNNAGTGDLPRLKDRHSLLA